MVKDLKKKALIKIMTIIMKIILVMLIKIKKKLIYFIMEIMQFIKISSLIENHMIEKKKKNSKIFILILYKFIFYNLMKL